MDDKQTPVQLKSILIRTVLRPGDMGYIVHLHGVLYKEECDYGLGFETYVASGLVEFCQRYDPKRDRVWICEHQERIIGFLLLMHRDEQVAQLRYFLLEPEYRGIGLGKKLMELYMDHLKLVGYRSTYLWTTRDQETAISLYKRYGFRLTEEKSSDAFGKPLVEQKYELEIYVGENV